MAPSGRVAGQAESLAQLDEFGQSAGVGRERYRGGELSLADGQQACGEGLFISGVRCPPHPCLSFRYSDHGVADLAGETFRCASEHYSIVGRDDGRSPVDRVGGTRARRASNAHAW